MKRFLCIVVAALAVTTTASAQTAISSLPQATTGLSGSEIVPIVQSGTTKQVAARDIANAATAIPSTSITGLGTAATQNTGTTGAAIPLLNTSNAWSAKQTFFASTSTSASLSIPQGTAPSTPSNGDVWSTTDGIYAKYGSTSTAKLARAHATNVMDYGAVCDGAHTHDDASAFQSAIEAAGYLGIVRFPAGCYLDTTVNVDQAVMIEGPGIAGDMGATSTGLYVPNVTAFNVTKPNVTLRGIHVVGNRSASTSNIFVLINNAAQSNLENIRCELLNGCVAVSGGYFGRARNIMARNVVRYVFRLMDSSAEASSSGVAGVDYFIDNFTYDTDTATYATPTVATIWLQDYEALVMQNYDMIHGGQIATVYVNPQYTRSGDHLFGRGFFDINEVGDSLLIKPEGAAISNRSSVVGAWIATGQNGVHFSGANASADGWSFRSNWFYNLSKHAFLNDSTSTASGTITLNGNVFSANGTAATGTYNDISVTSTNPNLYLSIIGNSFNNSSNLSSNVVLHNIVLPTTGGAYLANNDFQFSPASGEKVTGLDLNAHKSPDTYAVFSIGASSSVTLGAMSGLLQVDDTTTGDNCLFLLGGNNAVLISQTQGSTCVASASPSTSQVGVAYSSGAYKIFNGFSSTRSVNALITQIRNAN